MKKQMTRFLSKLARCIIFSYLAIAPCSFADSLQPLPLVSVSGVKQPIQFADFTGKVVLIDFWASWCGPCRQSFPWMNDMQAKYSPHGFEVIAINLDSEFDEAISFLKEVPANFTIGFDSEGITAEKMQVEAMPMSYLIDRQGNVRYRMMGFNNGKKAEHEAHIKTLLNEARR